MKNSLKCSIVIRTHNHAAYLERLLKKIKLQKNVLPPEIIVIDSKSKDKTKDICKKYGCQIIEIDPSTFTHASTFNLGAKSAKNEIILYASVDVIPKNDLWLFNLLKHFTDKKVAGVFSKQEPIKNFNFIEEFKLKKMFPDNGTTIAKFSNASGALRKSVWKKIKYDENVPYQHIGGEDQTLIAEAKKLGYKVIYEPESVVYHSHKHNLKSRIKMAYQIELNKEQVSKWNQDVAMLNYSKKDLIKYLIKKKAFKDLFVDLILGGILMRLYALKAKVDRKKN